MQCMKSFKLLLLALALFASPLAQANTYLNCTAKLPGHTTKTFDAIFSFDLSSGVSRYALLNHRQSFEQNLDQYLPTVIKHTTQEIKRTTFGYAYEVHGYELYSFAECTDYAHCKGVVEFTTTAHEKKHFELSCTIYKTSFGQLMSDDEMKQYLKEKADRDS